MKTEDTVSERLANQLLLDIKAFMMVQESDIEAKHKINRMILESHDEHINRFVKLLSRQPIVGRGSYILTAIGEMLLASFLIISGFVILAPSIAGINSSSQLYDYFSGLLLYLTSGGPFFPLTKIIGFVIAALLLLAAVFSLRLASLSLKEAEMMVQPAAD